MQLGGNENLLGVSAHLDEIEKPIMMQDADHDAAMT